MNCFIFPAVASTATVLSQKHFPLARGQELHRSLALIFSRYYGNLRSGQRFEAEGFSSPELQEPEKPGKCLAERRQFETVDASMPAADKEGHARGRQGSPCRVYRRILMQSHSIALCFLSIALLRPAFAEPLIGQDEVHNIHFHSERASDKADVIEYLACNMRDGARDFFWSGAAFGLAELRPLAADQCVERRDYASRMPSGPGDVVRSGQIVRVLDQSGEVPTVLWCDFLGLNRCNNYALGFAASSLSQLRFFAKGASSAAFQPVIEVESTLKNGQYKIEIRRAQQDGHLIVVVKRPSKEGHKLEIASDNQTKHGSLSEFRNEENSQRAIWQGLSSDMPAVAIFSPADSDQPLQLALRADPEAHISLAIIAASFDGPLYRFDAGLDLGAAN